MEFPFIIRRSFLKVCGAGAAGSLLSQSVAPQNANAQSDTVSRLMSGVKWFTQSGFRIQNGGQVVYVDPWHLSKTTKDADLVLITHPHGDHCEAASIQKIVKPGTQIVAEKDSIEKLGGQFNNASVISLGETKTLGALKVEAVRAYNNTKTFHPKANNWLGYVMTLQDGRVIYHAGDTDNIAEMRDIDADVALLPAGGNYTMEGVEAAAAAKAIQPKVAMPIHWGAAVGSIADARNFESNLAGTGIEALIMKNNQEFPVLESGVGGWKKK